ncbi:ENHANCED DOWNY MILDEW 2-like protein [Drosera capensis]
MHDFLLASGFVPSQSDAADSIAGALELVDLDLLIDFTPQQASLLISLSPSLALLVSRSDSEEEDSLLMVSNYYFEDDNQDPVSFSVPPIQWDNNGVMISSKKQIFLHGMINDGLDRIYKLVTAWNFDLLGPEPHVSVFSKDNKWWKLEKPRKNFRNIIRSTLITLHCLHVLKKNPDLSERSLWDRMSRVFGWCDIRPSQNDLVDHWAFIEEAVKKDTSFIEFKVSDGTTQGKATKERRQRDSERFIDDRDDIEVNGSKSRTDEEQEQSFAVCEICDNGGDVLRQVVFPWVLHECVYEAFLCINATCGRFYHPQCVAKLLQQDAASAAELERKVCMSHS